MIEIKRRTSRMAHMELSSELIQMFCEKMQRMGEGEDLIFPIKKLKGLKVRVILKKQAVDNYILTIEPQDIVVKNNHVYTCNLQKDHYLERVPENEFIRDCAESILTSLKSIQIDKFNGIFITQKMIEEKKTGDKDEELWKQFCYDFAWYTSLLLDFYDCEMCFKSTKTKINCMHSLCLECLISLEVDALLIDGNYYRKCPLCHQQITNLIS